MNPSPAQRRARAGPGLEKSCWARAHVGPKNRDMGWPMGLVLNGHLYVAHWQGHLVMWATTLGAYRRAARW
jgi:hypothetical protein